MIRNLASIGEAACRRVTEYGDNAAIGKVLVYSAGPLIGTIQMNSVKETDQLAVLIDADNAQPSIIEGLLAERRVERDNHLAAAGSYNLTRS